MSRENHSNRLIERNSQIVALEIRDCRLNCTPVTFVGSLIRLTWDVMRIFG